MNNPTHPKTPVIVIMNRLLATWYDAYYGYYRTLDRVDGQIQWTEEAIAILDTIYDTMIDNLISELSHYDLDTRTALNAFT